MKKQEKRVANVAKEPLANFELDSYGKAIVNQLREDGRRSYRMIAAKVGLSEAAVRQRVNQLIKGKAIKITVLFEPSAVGMGRAWVGLRVDGDLRKVREEMHQLPNIDFVLQSFGCFDLILFLIYKDNNEHLDTLAAIRGVSGVKEMTCGLAVESWDSLFLSKII